MASQYDNYQREQDNFMEYELLPRIISDPRPGFPEFSFSQSGSNWVSMKHTDNLAPRKQHKTPCTTLYANSGQIVDNSHGGSDNIIWWKVRYYNKTLHETLEELANAYGISHLLPTWDSDEEGNYTQLREARQSLLEDTISLLWSDDPEAREVLDYVRSRGWTDEEIKKAQLGYIDEATRNKYDIIFKWVQDGKELVQRSAGTSHRLTIPYVTGGSLLGLKLRDIHHNEGEEKAKKAADPNYKVKDKYKNTHGLSKGAAFFGVPVYGRDIVTKTLVLVEGDLDARHAQVKGFPYIAGTAGSKVSDSQVRDALRRGVTRFTLLFDNDEAGAGFVRPSIETIEKLGGDEVEVRIATIPQGEGKDLDEYLKTHTIEDLEKLLDHSTLSCELKYKDILNNYVQLRETQGAELTPVQQQDYKNEVQGVINDPHTRDNRERIFQEVKNHEKDLGFVVEASYRDWVDQQYYQDKARTRKQEVSSATQKIQDALSTGNVDRALRIMAETTERVQQFDKREEYNRTLAKSSLSEMARLARESKGGLKTGYMFKSGDATKKVPLDLNEGLTFVSANTGHGKTSFLNNVTINVAKRNLAQGSDKSVLFFSYEVSKLQILAGLLNVFYNDPLISDDPQSAILSYLRGEGNKEFYKDRALLRDARPDVIDITDEMAQEIKSERYGNFLKSVTTFDKMLRKGSIIVAETSYSVEELVNSIKWYLKQSRPTLVCIDYVQLIYSEMAKGKQRYEEVKQIVNDLKTLANTEHIPFLLASQFNRSVESPLDLQNSNVGESGSIERVADTSIGLFNLKELHKLKGQLASDNKELAKTLTDVGLPIEWKGDESKAKSPVIGAVDGKIFARLMKRRYGYYPIDILLDWEGKTKYITPNDPDFEKVDEEATLNLDKEPTYQDPNDPLGLLGTDVQVTDLPY